jgi:hypothetical protein
MTQHSQSPPNSLQPLQTNGPISFSNILPNSQNPYKATSPTYISPSFIANSSNKNGEWESSSSSTSLLGKRKSNETDENSNSQKKIFKKSVESSSFPIKNNISSQNQHLKSYNSMLSSSQLVNHQEKNNVDIPKKRGRKKGSKGIDCTLNGVFPDFRDEIQQKIALSAGKRNKTTFELQKMLESCQNADSNNKKGDVLDSNLFEQG